MAAAVPIIMTAAGTAQVYGAFSEGQALRRQGRLESLQNKFNSRMAEYAAEDAVARGEKSAAGVRQAGRQVQGAQRAAYASQGVLVDAGTAKDVQESTRELTEADVNTVKNNAWREAFGYQVKASDLRLASSYARYSSKEEARNTILTGSFQGLATGVSGFRKK